MIRKITPFIMAALCLLTIHSFAQDSRLIGHNTIRYNNGWEPYDTARIIYDPGNNMPTSFSTYDLNGIKYDTMYRAGWDGTMYVDSRRNHKIYNTGGYCTERIEYQLYPTLALDTRTVYTYDGNNNILEELTQDWDGSNWENNVHILRTFDGNNNTLTQKVEYWDGTTWASSYLSVFTYDGNNNMQSSVGATLNTTTQVYDSTYRTEIFYNGDNLRDSSRTYDWNSGWVLNGRTFDYYGVNDINMGYLYQNIVNGNWVNGGQGFTLLNGNNVIIGDSAQTWNTTSNSWVNFIYGRHTLDGNDRSIEYRAQMWNTTLNAWEDEYLDSILYNSFDQYVWFKRISWDPANQTWGQTYNDQETHYYYETYTANKVTGINKSAGQLLLYPVPAKTFININMQWNKAQDFTVGIYDIQGRLVSQWGEKATEKYNKRISLNGLASGTYILKVRGKDATVQEQFVIMD